MESLFSIGTYNCKIFLVPFFRGLINNLKREDSVIISRHETKLMYSQYTKIN